MRCEAPNEQDDSVQPFDNRFVLTTVSSCAQYIEIFENNEQKYYEEDLIGQVEKRAHERMYVWQRRLPPI